MSRRNARKNPPPDLESGPLPEVIIANRQRSLRIDLPRIRRIVRAALPLCLAERGPLPPVLPALREI